MKRKVKKISNSKDRKDIANGIATFRITGASELTGERVTVIFTGTREQANKYILK